MRGTSIVCGEDQSAADEYEAYGRSSQSTANTALYRQYRAFLQHGAEDWSTYYYIDMHRSVLPVSYTTRIHGCGFI